MAKKKQEVKNTKETINTSEVFNDYDILRDVLTSLKGMVNVYNTFLIETSNSELNAVIKNLYNEVSSSQRNIFNIMFEKGWYILETMPSNKLQKKSKQLKQLKDQM